MRFFENNNFSFSENALRTGTKIVKFSENKKLCYWDIALQIKLNYFEFSMILIEKPLVRSREDFQKIRKLHVLSKRFRVVPISHFTVKIL